MVKECYKEKTMKLHLKLYFSTWVSDINSLGAIYIVKNEENIISQYLF